MTSTFWERQFEIVRGRDERLPGAAGAFHDRRYTAHVVIDIDVGAPFSPEKPSLDINNVVEFRFGRAGSSLKKIERMDGMWHSEFDRVFLACVLRFVIDSQLPPELRSHTTESDLFTLVGRDRLNRPRKAPFRLKRVGPLITAFKFDSRAELDNLLRSTRTADKKTIYSLFAGIDVHFQEVKRRPVTEEWARGLTTRRAMLLSDYQIRVVNEILAAHSPEFREDNLRPLARYFAPHVALTDLGAPGSQYSTPEGFFQFVNLLRSTTIPRRFHFGVATRRDLNGEVELDTVLALWNDWRVFRDGWTGNVQPGGVVESRGCNLFRFRGTKLIAGGEEFPAEAFGRSVRLSHSSPIFQRGFGH